MASLFLLVAGILLGAARHGSSVSFNFSSFQDKLTCQIDAYWSNAIQVTAIKADHRKLKLTNSTGRAFYSEPVPIWDRNTGQLTDFTTHFTFTIDAIVVNINKAYPGDGLAFFLSPFPLVMPDVQDFGGGLLGLFYAGSKFNSSPDHPVVAVEFDTYYNYEWDVQLSDHVGIDVDSIKSVVSTAWTDGNMSDGRIANAWITYNASTTNLSVFLTYDKDPVLTGRSPTLSYIVNLRNILPENATVGFSASSGARIETHTVLSWEFNSSLTVTPPTPKKKKSRHWAVVATLSTLISAGVLGSVVGLLLWRRMKLKSMLPEEEEDNVMMSHMFEKGSGPKSFPYSELVKATKNFSNEWKLGEGGFGDVFRGILKDLDVEVAIKKVSRGSKQGKKEYISEVNIISKLRHRNLVQLLGWCHEKGELMLVYEYMRNQSLDKHLYKTETILSWELRYKIAQGLATALLYLQEDCHQCIVHRDLKPSNVMLDSTFNAKLGDFGLARLVDHDREAHNTIVAGTQGYLAPEVINVGTASKESDVYSFGVTALEVACGRRPVVLGNPPGEVFLVEWVWDLYGKSSLLGAADKRLNGEFVEEQMERLMVVGLWCAHPDYSCRPPSMKRVISVLNLEEPLPRLPKKMPALSYSSLPVEKWNRLIIASEYSPAMTGSTTNLSNSNTSSTSASTSSASPSSHLLSEKI